MKRKKHEIVHLSFKIFKEKKNKLLKIAEQKQYKTLTALMEDIIDSAIEREAQNE